MAQEGSRGVTVKDVAAQDFVIAYAAHLKRIGKIEVPKWADLVKTAAFKELAPYDQDWYYIRAGGPWPSRDSPPLLRPAYAAPRPPPVPGCGRSLAALPAWPRSAGHATALCQTCAGRLPVAQKHGLGGWVGRACDRPHSPCLVADARCRACCPAAIARRVYLRGDVGVGAFKKIFGGRAHRGTRPEKFATGSGAIARHILRQLEALKIVEHIPEGKEGHRKGCAAAP